MIVLDGNNFAGRGMGTIALDDELGVEPTQSTDRRVVQLLSSQHDPRANDPFCSSSVYQLRVARWPGMARTLALPSYLAGCAAASRAMPVRLESSLVCIEDSSSFILFGPLMNYHDAPKVYRCLSQEGYSVKLVRPKDSRMHACLQVHRSLSLPIHSVAEVL